MAADATVGGAVIPRGRMRLESAVVVVYDDLGRPRWRCRRRGGGLGRWWRGRRRCRWRGRRSLSWWRRGRGRRRRGRRSLGGRRGWGGGWRQRGRQRGTT